MEKKGKKEDVTMCSADSLSFPLSFSSLLLSPSPLPFSLLRDSRPPPAYPRLLSAPHFNTAPPKDAKKKKEKEPKTTAEGETEVSAPRRKLPQNHKEQRELRKVRKSSANPLFEVLQELKVRCRMRMGRAAQSRPQSRPQMETADGNRRWRRMGARARNAMG